ncbi:MAG: hypothetical protein PCFJNLEI_04168 [Verrucomicrobiae bacterium]|nr:hypothetical protein [Verrucomicrobiae bacterium]
MSATNKQPNPGKGDWWLIVFFIGCVAVLVVSVSFIWRKLGQPKPAATRPPPAAAQPVPPTPPLVVTPLHQPAPAPPLDVSVRAILSDPEAFLGKLIRTPGIVQFHDTKKETFDLQQGNYVLPVKYQGLTITSRQVMITGILRRDESLNTPTLAAQQIEPQ